MIVLKKEHALGPGMTVCNLRIKKLICVMVKYWAVNCTRIYENDKTFLFVVIFSVFGSRISFKTDY